MRVSKKIRTWIPQRIRNQVLDESFWGCAVPTCEAELIQIHHINEDPTENEPANLLPLCGYHHDMATRGTISIKDCYSLKANLRKLNRTNRIDESFFIAQKNRLAKYVTFGRFNEVLDLVTFIERACKHHTVIPPIDVTAFLHAQCVEAAVQTGVIREAIVRADIVHAIYKEQEDFLQQAEFSGMLGITHKIRKQYKSAEALYLRGLSDLKRIDNAESKFRKAGWLYVLLAILYVEKKEIRKAEKMIFLAEKSYSKVTALHVGERAELRSRTAQVFLAGQRYSMAETILLETDDYIKQNRWPSYRVSTNKIWTQLLISSGALDEAASRFSAAWINAAGVDHHRRGLLEVALTQPAVCTEPILEELISSHSTCNRCCGTNITKIIQCEIARSQVDQAIVFQ